MSAGLTPEAIYGNGPATDQDWASPLFDDVNRLVADMLDPDLRYVGDGLPNYRQRRVQQIREHRPYLIANIRRNLGDPKWDPRGAQVISFRSALADKADQ